MKLFLHISAVVLVALGIAYAFKGDMVAYRFGIILGMLCNIYAETKD